MKEVLIHSGKVKRVLLDEIPRNIKLVFSDFTTAGDGESRVEIPGKGKLSRQIAANCFKLLAKKGVPTSFRHSVGPIEDEVSNTLLATYAHPIPLEVVCRGVATGSYIKRNPEIAEGTVLGPYVVEFFVKDDARHDPLLKVKDGSFTLWNAKLPPQDPAAALGPFVPEGKQWEALLDRPFDNSLMDVVVVDPARAIVRQTFQILQFAWKQLGYTLIDLKIEVGFDPDKGIVMVDAITPDEWRLWKNGDKTQSFDKDPFRKSAEKDSEAMKKFMLQRYMEIAALTDQFR